MCAEFAQLMILFGAQPLLAPLAQRYRENHGLAPHGRMWDGDSLLVVDVIKPA